MVLYRVVALGLLLVDFVCQHQVAMLLYTKVRSLVHVYMRHSAQHHRLRCQLTQEQELVLSALS